MYEHIRGSTFQFAGPIYVGEYDPANHVYVPLVDLTGWQPSSHVRDSMGQIIAVLDAVWLDASQALLSVSAAGSTADWKLGRARMDVRLISPSGDTVYTPVEEFVITKEVTRNAEAEV